MSLLSIFIIIFSSTFVLKFNIFLDSESEMNQNQESFITTASKLLEKAKQKQLNKEPKNTEPKPTPVAASAQNSIKIN